MAHLDGTALDLRSLVPSEALLWLDERPDERHRRSSASLVLADVSGFTAMSERLARLGRAGAEEVTELLDRCFSRLLAAAYEHGGSLLKFGGDALLLHFEGPDHTARAVRAAWTLRQEMRALQPLESSAGRVRLRISIGVHTGAVDLFLVGADHRELVVAGPAATAVVRVGGAARAGQVVVSQSVVDALGDRVAVVPGATGSLLRSPPSVAASWAGVPLSDLGRSLAPSLLPALVRSRLEDGTPSSEHRLSAVGFVGFSRVDDHLASYGSERTATDLAHLVDAVVDACRRYEVCLLASDVAADGGKLLVTAGVPAASEFTGERVLRAVRQVVTTSGPFALCAGVHHGPVFAGVVGPPFRLSYTVIGDAVNLAARVMAHAAAGEVLATPAALDRAQALFRLERLPPFAAKGKRQPVTASRVGDVTGSRVVRERGSFGLAGRQDELARLEQVADRAARGPGRAVRLTGAAGIGKSRLVEELQERRPGTAFVAVGCSPAESTTPNHVLGRLLRGLLGLGPSADADELGTAVRREAPDLLDALPLLGDVLGIALPDNGHTAELTAGFRSARAAAVAVELLEATVPEPAVLVVEDLHWADPESRAGLVALHRTALPRRRWLLLLTSRDPDALTGSEEVEDHVALWPLDETDGRQLVYAAAEEGLVSVERGQQLQALAGGNPFFLQELLRSDPARRGDDLPETVDDLVQSQLDALAPEQRLLLSDAAVLGVDVDPDLLDAMAGVDLGSRSQALSSLAGLLEPAARGGFRFRHALLQEAAYQRLPFRRRRELHRKAAAALEARGDAAPLDLLALHTHRARDWGRARDYSLAAAAQASDRHATLTAVEHYRRAVDAGRHLPDLPDEAVARDWERLGDALMLSSSYDDAATAYQRARRLAPAAWQVRLCGQVGQLRERQGRYREALRWYSKALALDGPAGAQRSRLLCEAAIVRNRQGRLPDAVALADEAERSGPDLTTRARIHYVRAWAAMMDGRDNRAERELSLALFEQAGDLLGQSLAYGVIALSGHMEGDWDEAVSAYERGATLRRRLGDEVAAAVVTGNLGEILSDQGHFAAARERLQLCRDHCAAAGFPSSQHFAAMHLGRLDARLGRHTEAERQLQEALAALQQIGLAGLVFECRRFLAEAALFRGDLVATLERASALESGAYGSSGIRAFGKRLRACVHLVRGELPQARQAAEDLLVAVGPDARDYEAALAVFVAAEVLAATGETAQAAALHDRSARHLQRLHVTCSPRLLAFGPSSADARP